FAPRISGVCLAQSSRHVTSRCCPLRDEPPRIPAARLLNRPSAQIRGQTFIRSHSMEVILKEDVAKLGSRGDVVKVAEGYGRNFLLPRKLAIEASKGNKAVIDQMRAASVRRSAKEKTQAEELSKQFDGLSVLFQRKSGENDQLFGSVTSSDIAEALAKK